MKIKFNLQKGLFFIAIVSLLSACSAKNKCNCPHFGKGKAKVNSERIS